MKRYLVFAGSDFYPGGGWEDFFGAYNSLSEALEAGERAEREHFAWHHIVDLETLETVGE